MADFTYNNHALCQATFDQFDVIPQNVHGWDSTNFDADTIPQNVHGWDPTKFDADAVPQNVNDWNPTVGMTQGGPFTCRMKGFDSVLNTWVYWSSAGNDPTGRNYRGPGTVSRVVVAFVFPARQQAASL